MEDLDKVGDVGDAGTDTDVPVVLPVTSVVFHLEFGIGAVTDDNELGESCRRNLKVHQQRNYRLHPSED